jgi:hypothetical protein
MIRRLNIRAILRDPKLRARLIANAVRSSRFFA